MTFSALDWAVVAAYFLMIFGVAFWVRAQASGSRSSADYFLAGRNVGWFVIGASLFASNIGAEHLVGLAGTGAASGIAVAQFEILASLILLILGWVFVPFYISSGVFTMPQFLERRYSKGPRTYLAIISIIGYVLTKISVTVAAGGIVFEALMGIEFWTGAVIVVVATGIYTLFGGLKAVLYTDMIQMFVLLFGAIMVTVLGLNAIGGWSAFTAEVDPAMLDLWQPMDHPDFPWTGILFGAPILGVWYWCTDQFIVQRVLSARSIAEARRGTIFAGFLKQLPLFIFVIPGLIAYVLSQSGQLQLDHSDQALPALIGALLPAGLRGVVAAGLLAALMSSLSSVFNSCATLISFDVYKRVRPAANDRSLIIVGQVSVIVLVLLGLLWIPYMDLISSRLYTYIQSVQAYISPPIAAVFLIGVLWPRANAKGAMAALAVGFVLGMGRLVMEANSDALDGFALVLATENFLHIAVALFVVCSMTLVAVSLATQAPSSEQTKGLTFGQLRDEFRPSMRDKVTRQDIVLTVILLALVAVVWGMFSG
ncbi:MAG: solute:sodium symporter family transporter [Lysobacteraceae bacterium]|nr:MAG: solute:sodium symporter family transporter [Xanthomonadaceae bacterium]